MKTSEVLNKAADLIEERGWGSGPASMYGQAGICVMGAIRLADSGEVDGDYCAAHLCGAGQAVYAYLTEKGYDDPVPSDLLWVWNDDRSDAAEVIEVLRATAVIEAAREEAAERVAVNA